jgi:hypothetical protein
MTEDIIFGLVIAFIGMCIFYRIYYAIKYPPKDDSDWDEF